MSISGFEPRKTFGFAILIASLAEPAGDRIGRENMVLLN